MGHASDRTRDPEARRVLAKDLRDIRRHYRARGMSRYGNRFCRAMLGNFYTGLMCSPGPEFQD